MLERRHPAGDTGGGSPKGRSCSSGVFPCPFLVDGAADVDEIIGDHAEPDPALHSIFAFVPTAVEAVSPLGHADAALAAGPPFLTVAEPALLLFASALSAFGGAVGYADALDALGFTGIEGCVGSHQVRHASDRRLVGPEGVHNAGGTIHSVRKVGS